MGVRRRSDGEFKPAPEANSQNQKLRRFRSRTRAATETLHTRYFVSIDSLHFVRARETMILQFRFRSRRFLRAQNQSKIGASLHARVRSHHRTTKRTAVIHPHPVPLPPCSSAPLRPSSSCLGRRALTPYPPQRVCDFTHNAQHQKRCPPRWRRASTSCLGG